MLGQALEADGLQIPRDEWLDQPWRHRFLIANLEQRLPDILRDEWRPPGQEFVEHRAQTIYVHFRTRSAPRPCVGQFRSQVGGCSEEQARPGRNVVVVVQFGQTKIGQPRLEWKRLVRRLPVRKTAAHSPA